jgi:biotin transport system permease protein
MRPWTDPVGLYRPGATWLHRLPARAKLGGLLVLGLVLVVLRGPLAAVVALACAVWLAVGARLPARATAIGLAPISITALLVGLYQTWQRGWPLGVEVAADLMALVLAATVVTATTPTDALLELLTRALRPVRRWVAPESVALAVALMLRTIPALGLLFGEVRDAARARGLERSPRAQLVPFVIRAVGRAQQTGDALAARGIGD